MAETLEVMVRAWTEAPLVHQGKFYQLSLPSFAAPLAAPAPADLAQRLLRGLCAECGRLGAPIMMARIPLARVPERLAPTRRACGERPRRRGPAAAPRQAALWRSSTWREQAQAEDELTAASSRPDTTWSTPATLTRRTTRSTSHA